MIVIACSLWIAACATLPRSFTPKTPDEQAAARTMETFLLAVRAQDFDRVSTVITPEATVVANVQGRVEAPQRILALRQSVANSPLLQVAPDRLVDYRQSSPDTATVGAYVHGPVGVEIETTHFTWELQRHNGQWRIHAMKQTAWSTPHYVRAGGP
jgi:ketosteroid isomerase-like protein